MRTDNELLELAAEAAGIKLCWGSKPGKIECPALLGSTEWTWWNPLTDDGDALRLAVKLRIKFRYNEALGQALAWTVGAQGFEAHANIEDCNRDEYACARLAIVRAAAGIGAAA
jgi:hypothetical protein